MLMRVHFPIEPVNSAQRFLTLNAEVEFRIAMTPEDLGRANLDALGKKWS